MKNAYQKICNSPCHQIPSIVVVLLFFICPAIAQKSLSSKLEINQQSQLKNITLFDSEKRFNPNKNILRRNGKRIFSTQTIKSIVSTYLSRNKRKLDINDIYSDFRLEDISKSPAGTHISYQELMNGIPVYDAKIVLTLNQFQEISFVTRNYYSINSSLNMEEKIQSENAIEIARQYLGVTGELRGSQKVQKMVFHCNNKGPVLTYRINIPSKLPFGDWEVFVDAHNGDIIHAKNNLIYKTGTNGKGLVWDPDPLTTKGVYYGGDFIDNNDQDHDSLNALRRLVTLNDLYTDEQGKYILHGPFIKLADIDAPLDEFPHLSDPDSFIYTRQEQEFEAVMVYYHIDKSYRRLIELGFFASDTVQGLLEFEADPHGNDGLDNSYYSPFLNYCAFGEGGVDDAEDAAVIWHEYAHAIQFNISEISHNTEGETRSLIEGCADYWAASYNRRNHEFAWNHVFLWDAGIQSEQGDTTFWAGRRCDLDWKYSKDDSAQYSGTHFWGQIWSSALMRIWGDLGADITDKIFVASHYYWGTHPDFSIAAEAFIQADIDIYGGSHLPVILKWFEYFKILSRNDYEPEITHNPLTDIQITPDTYQISCRIIPSKASLDTSNLWLIWSKDTLFADSTHLLSDTISNIYRAEIPAVKEPTSIKYYFYARDSLDIFSVNPTDAPLDYFSFYAGPDSLPPPPQNIIITDSVNVVNLTWQEIITGKFVSYHIYRSENIYDFISVDTIATSSFSDTTVNVGHRYYYYITTVFNQFESNPSDTVEVVVQAITSLSKHDVMPVNYQLYQNFPNPFNPRTIISYELPTTNDIDLTIYNILGEKVATLVSERKEAGYYQVEWDAVRFSSGVYYYILRAGEFTDVKKMVLLR